MFKVLDGVKTSMELTRFSLHYQKCPHVCAEEPAPMIVGGLALAERQPCFTVTVTECPGGIEPRTRWDANSGAAFSPALPSSDSAGNPPAVPNVILFFLF
ncbi:hypothetical protein CEXT_601851 [Caerostris extrusa]|uniref:Uncharacterized protein n=1 Tax=Caerostris extrusa TaxID=172846 RepID=A0AAV4MPD2_CAEEX|nr:hypothetical protein CEXT_601851 [Caerostris extrusa]